MAADGLTALKNVPGIDARAVKELEANLTALKARADHCSESVKTEMQKRLAENVFAIVRDACDAAKAVLNNPKQRKNWLKVGGAFRDLDALRKAILDLPEADRPAALRNFFEGDDTPVGKAMQAVFARISHDLGTMWDLGLHDFVHRLERLVGAFAEGAFENPIDSLDAKILGEVLRGETDLMNYIGLKEANLPEEMLRFDLDIEHAVKTGKAGEGAFNSVDFYDIQDIRTGRTERYVVKNVELAQDKGAAHGVAAGFSSPRHARNAAKLNYASWKGANLIGCGSSITRSGVVRINGRYQLVQEVAEGKELFDWRKKQPDFNATIQKYPISVKRRLWREMHIATAKLEWADWLSGQLDRTIHNELFNYTVDTSDPAHPRVQVSLKGIDNDAAFPERRPGLYGFCTRNGDWIMDEKHVTQERMDYVLRECGVRGVRKPIFLPKSVQTRLAKMSVREYAHEMAPYLSAEALEAAVSRFTEMKEAAAKWPKECVIDDSVSTDMMSDEELERQVSDFDTVYGAEYQELMDRIGEPYMSNAGGFYGYLVGLSKA